MTGGDGLGVMAALEASGALRRGHFRLSSGRHSAAYVQCALLLEQPSRARRIGTELAALFDDLNLDSVVSPALGGLVIGHEVAAALGLPFRFTERKDGRMSLRRGFVFRPGEQVLLIEDVVTTGKSSREAVAVVEASGARVLAVGSIIDRSSGQAFPDQEFRSLLTLALESFAPQECPMCAAGEPVDSPGSRRS